MMDYFYYLYYFNINKIHDNNFIYDFLNYLIYIYNFVNYLIYMDDFNYYFILTVDI